MHGKLLFIIFTFGAAYCSAQYTFEKNYYLNGYEPYNISPGAISTIDSGYYITGFCGDTNTSYDFLTYLTRLDKNGQIVWSKVSDLYTSVINAGYGLGQIVQYPDSSIVILWNDQDSQGYNFRAGYAHIDKNGNSIWGRKYITPPNRADIYMNSFARTEDNGLIGAGTFVENISGLPWIFILKTDSAGNIQWCKQYFPDSSSGYSVDEAPRITTMPDSGFLYTFEASDSITDIWYGYLMKMDAQGNVQWSKRYNENMDDIDFTLPQISEGYIYLPMLDTSFTSIAVIKTNMQGVPIWNYEYWSPSNQIALDGMTDVNGSTILSGRTMDTLSFILKIDSSGNILWSYKYGKADSNQICNLLLTQDGGILGYGWGPLYYSAHPKKSFFNLTKTDAWGVDGCEQPYPITKTALPLVYSDVHIKAYPVAMTQLDTILNFHDAPMDTTTLCAVRNVSSVKTIKSNNTVIVYPNPANNILHIETSNIDKCYFYLYDGLGNLVQKTELKNDFTILSLTRLAVGMYYYRILDEYMKPIKSDKLLIIR